MEATHTIVLATGLGLEVIALRNPGNVCLKLAATLASIGYLIYFIIHKPSGSFATVWPLGMNIYCLAQRCWNYLWLSEPHDLRRLEEHREESTSDDRVVQKPKGPDTIRGRCKAMRNAEASCIARHSVKDALDISLTFRGLGWSFQARGVPKLPESCKSAVPFVFSQLKGAVCQFLILDLAITYVNSTCKSLDHASAPFKILVGGLMVLYVRWTMDIPYRVMSVLAVMSGSSKPQDWPPLFGLWRDAFTVRRFWASTWHQGMRLLAEPPVEHITNSWLQLPKGSTASKWSKIYGNFMVAFADHAYGRIIASGSPKCDLVFFILQPTAIWIEELVREGGVRLGWLGAKERSAVEQWLGYLWTAAFQCWTFLYFMEGVIRVQGSVTDTLIEPAFGVSLFKYLLG